MPLNSRNTIAVNVTSSVVQVVITGIVYFFVYRILVIKLGVEMLGVWSLIIATASISNLSNFGFNSAVVKYVAEYNAKAESERINKLIYTSLIFISILFIILAAIIYLGAFLFIDKLIDPQYTEMALVILPISLTGLFFYSLCNVLTSAIEGFQKNYIRNFAYAFASVLYLFLAIILIPRSGLTGLAIAQVIQIIVVLIISYYYLKRYTTGFGILRIKWYRDVFVELLEYGYKMQLISIFQILTDPITKILISRFHGISTLGFFEMASRMITQLRQIIAGMDQVTIPIVSHFQQTEKKTVRYIYEKGFSFIIFIVFPLYAGIILFTPYLSRIWIGNVEPVFVYSTYILATGMLINILNAQAYFNSLGEGHLSGVLFMTLFVLIFNTLSGIIFGLTVPVYGVVIAYAISTALGSVLLIRYYHKKNNIRLVEILKRSDIIIILSGIVFALLSGIVLTEINKQYDYSYKIMLFYLIIYFTFFFLVSHKNDNFKLLNIFQYFSKH